MGVGGGRRYGGPSVVNRRILLNRVESCKQNYSTINDIVDHLRSNYRDYRGLKEKPFARVVQQTLNSLSLSQQSRITKPSPSISSPSTSTQTKRRPEHDSYDEDREDHNNLVSAARRKRSKKGHDETELRLQRLEDAYLLRQSDNKDPTSSSLSSSAVFASDEEEDDSDDDDDGAVSTSEDAIYSEKVEPEFDLMKSMLRATYTDSKSAKPKPLAEKKDVELAEEKNVELEVAVDNNKAVDTIYMTKNESSSHTDKGRLLGTETKKNEVAKGGSDDGVEVKEKEGPRFKDLGGMKGVLEELKMEVIVPLYHPQLPIWLGVRPMSGFCCTVRLAAGRPNWLMPLRMRPACPFIRFQPLSWFRVSQV